MTTLALQNKPRRALAWLHRWSGLVILLFVIIAALTGSIIAFKWELDRAINPQMWVVKPVGTPLPYNELIHKVESEFAGTFVGTIRLPKSPDEAVLLYLRPVHDLHVSHTHVAGMNMSKNMDYNQVFINPYTGEITGKRNTNKMILSRENFIPFMVRLHYTLFLDEPGAIFMGIVALAWFIGTFIGLALSWPKNITKWAAWKQMFSVRTKSGHYKVNYDLHRAASFYTLPVAIVLAFTSVYLNLPDIVKTPVNAVSPIFKSSDVKSAGKLTPADDTISVEQALLTTTITQPNAKPNQIGRDFNKGLYAVRYSLPGDVSPNGNNQLYIGMEGGKVVYDKVITETSGGTQFVNWMLPLHDGTAFRLVGQIIICISGIVLTLICVTSLNMWMHKNPGKKKKLKG